MKYLIYLLPFLLLSCDESNADKNKTVSSDPNDTATTNVLEEINPLVLSGTIGPEITVSMMVESFEDTMYGVYYYHHIGKMIDLDVDLMSDGTWRMREYVNGNHTGTFEGHLSDEGFNGNWTSPDGRVLTANLEVIPTELFSDALHDVEEDTEPKTLGAERRIALEDCMDASRFNATPLNDSIESEWGGYEVTIPEEVYSKFTKEEKLLFLLKFPETWEQICAPSPTASSGKIISELPFSDRGWSGRQYEFLTQNRDFIVNTLNNCIRSTREVDETYYHVLSSLEAIEVIPALISAYKKDKANNPLVLTMLRLFMVYDGEYAPYMEWEDSVELFKMPKTEDGYDDFEFYMQGAEVTPEIEEAILTHAQDFYNGYSL